MNLEELPAPRNFEMAATTAEGKTATIICRQVATIDTEVHIRHGTSLVLHNVRWFVTDRKVGEPLLGRPLLDALVLNTRSILAAAANRFAGSVDMRDMLDTSCKCGNSKISRILDGVYHADGGDTNSD